MSQTGPHPCPPQPFPEPQNEDWPWESAATHPVTPLATWLRERQKGIGGSDVAAILGLCPFNTRLSIYHDKLAEIPDDASEANPHDSEQAMRFWRGHKLEEPVAELFELETGLALYKPVAPIVQGIFRGNADRLMDVVLEAYEGNRTRHRIPLEIKTSHAYSSGDWGPSGSTSIPLHVAAQLAFYMMLLDSPRGYVACLIGGQDYRSYKLERNPQTEEIIKEECHAFWTQHVALRQPPEPEFDHRSTHDYLKRLYDKVEGGKVDLGEDILNAHLRRKEIGQQIRELKKEDEMEKAKILDAMGNAAYGRFFDGSGFRAKMIERKGYEVEAKTIKDVRFVKQVPA